MTAFIITRIQTGDYDRWRPMFDQDQPRAREKAQAQRVLRSAVDPNEVFIYLEYASLEDANEAHARIVSSGVLDRFADKHGPNVLVDAGVRFGRLRQCCGMFPEHGAIGRQLCRVRACDCRTGSADSARAGRSC